MTEVIYHCFKGSDIDLTAIEFGDESLGNVLDLHLEPESWYWGVIYNNSVQAPFDGPYPSRETADAAAQHHLIDALSRPPARATSLASALRMVEAPCICLLGGMCDQNCPNRNRYEAERIERWRQADWDENQSET